MIVSIHQPQYFPWVPYFDKILAGDVFVLLDNVQFQKNGLQNRNQIRDQQNTMWLTVPVKQNLGELIMDVEIAEMKAIKKHIRTLQMNYRKAAYHEEVMSWIEPVLMDTKGLLCDLNVALIRSHLQYLNYEGKIVLASELSAGGKGSDLVLNICRELGADTYLSGQGGKNYMDLESFKEAGIRVCFQEYCNQRYSQFNEGDVGFIPDLAAIDLIFNMGPNSRSIIEEGRST